MTRLILILIFLLSFVIVSEGRAESADEIIDRMRAAIENNLPDDFICRADCPLLQQLLERRLPAKTKQPVLRLYWKAPAKIRFVLEIPEASIPAQLMANILLHQRLSMAMARLGFTQESQQGKTFVDAWLDKLKGVDSQKTVQSNHTRLSVQLNGLERRDVVVVTFSGMRKPFYLGGVITRIKLWIDKDNYMPYQVRVFTSRTGILTLKIGYQRVNSSHGDLMLPSMLTLIPSLTEDGPTAAYPISATFTEYQVDTKLPDSLFNYPGSGIDK